VILKIGTVVRLKSGGLSMVVFDNCESASGKSEVYVAWHNRDGDLKTARCSLEILDLAFSAPLYGKGAYIER
jgi:uncharacterized protein YodC (DUF2158 family)